MKIMIHCCQKRLWYVEGVLIPELKKQGIDDIILWNDTNKNGCLKQFLASCMHIIDNMDINDGVWHLQDDIVVCRDFKTKIAEYEQHGIIVNGFTSSGDAYSNEECVGLQDPKHFWFSFQCCYIPNRYIHGFIKWYKKRCVEEGMHQKRIMMNKYEDYLFWLYVRQEHAKDMIYNVAPNLVEHIDYMIGGTQVQNNKAKDKNRRSYYWLDTELLDDVKRKIMEIKNGKTEN